MNQKSAYSCCILLCFQKNTTYNSIKDIIQSADNQMTEFNILNDLSESTKYSIVHELINVGILYSKTQEPGKQKTIHASKKIVDYATG